MVLWLYLRNLRNRSRSTEQKIEKAIAEGIHEPVSLHPVIDLDTCIGSGACIEACPEKDILGLQNGQATLINASSCVGHGACFHACPVEAISLCIGTEKRGVDLPHVNQKFESNVPGIYIAGELGGMGLIRNGVEQGRQAVGFIASSDRSAQPGILDLVIVGAGPAGISAALSARKHKLNFEILDQDTLGGTVFTFPRSKIVMTSPMDLPLYGKVKLYETSKAELLNLWETVLHKNNITVRERHKVESIQDRSDHFAVLTSDGGEFLATHVLLAIGRRGTPRKLGVPGEVSDKVAYRLIEPEQFSGLKILVVGGGDSAVEAAMALMEDNEVTISYRRDSFSRIKPKNREKVTQAIDSGVLTAIFDSNLAHIHAEKVDIVKGDGSNLVLENDRVFIFAGGELPTKFLENSGIQITRRFKYALRKHG